MGQRKEKKLIRDIKIRSLNLPPRSGETYNEKDTSASELYDTPNVKVGYIRCCYVVTSYIDSSLL